MESFLSLERYLEQLDRKITDIVRKPNHGFIEMNISTITGGMPYIGVSISDYKKVYYQFHTMFLQTHQEILYLKEIFQTVHSRFLDTLNHQWNYPA